MPNDYGSGRFKVFSNEAEEVQIHSHQTRYKQPHFKIHLEKTTLTIKSGYITDSNRLYFNVYTHHVNTKRKSKDNHYDKKLMFISDEYFF